jgi:hypothetical protein
MQTARTLEAERGENSVGSVSTRAKEDEPNTGHVWAAGFHRVMARYHLACVLKLMNH